MSDKTYDQNDGVAGSANPDVSRENVSGNQEQSGSEAYITKKEFEALQRQLQSQTDKAINNSVEARLRQMRAELDKTLQANKAAGIEIPPEKEAILRQQMIDRALFSDEAPASPKGQAQQGDLTWVTEAADDIMEEYGVHIPVRDLQSISADNPASYLKQVRELAKRKSGGRINEQPPSTTPPESRSFFGSNIGGVPTPQTQDTLRADYQKEIADYKATHPRATVEQLFDIREKWLSKGWNGS